MSNRSVSVALKAEVAQYVAGIKTAEAQTRSFMGELDKSTKKKQALADLGGAAGKMALVAGAGLGAMVATTANFDQAMSNVQAATHETTEGMESLRQAAIDAGADTAFSASEAAAGIENLAKAGVTTTEILGGGLQGALDLAAAGQISVGEAAEYAAKAMTMFDLAGDKVPHVADLLAAAAGKAVGEVGDFGQALNQAGLVAAQTGLSIEDTVGTLAAFAQAGLQGSDSGTALKSMLQRLQNPIGQGAKAMAELGINAYDANGNFIGITEVAGQLQDKLGGLKQAQRDAAMAQIFGSDAVRAATVLYKEGGEGIQGYIDGINDAGYATETAAIKLDNLKGDLEAFMGSLETAMIGAGEGSQGKLRGIVQGATDAVNALDGLPDSLKNAAVGMGAMTAVTGGGLWFGSKVIRGVTDTRDAIKDLGDTAPRTAGALGTLAKAAGGLLVLTAVGTAIEGIRGSFETSLPGMEEFTSELLKLKDGAGLGKDFEGLAEGLAFADSTAGGLASTVDGVTSALGPAGTALRFMGDQMTGATQGLEANHEGMLRLESQTQLIDRAFSNLVTSGGPEKAAEMFTAFADAENLSADAQKVLLDRMPEYSEALKRSENAASLAKDGVEGLGGAAAGAAGPIDDVTGAIKDAAEATYTWDDALDAIFGKLDRAAAADSWKSGLRDLAGELKPKGGLSRDTDKGMANREEIRSQVELLETHARAVAETSSNGVKVVKTILAGRDAIIAQATAAGIAEPEVRGYLDQLGLTPDEIATSVTLPGILSAREQVKALQTLYDLTPKEVTTIIEQANMDPSKRNIRELAEEYNTTPSLVRTLIQLDSERARRELADYAAAFRALNGQQVNTYVRLINTGTTPSEARAGILAGTRAEGGPVTRGDRYLIGERGPEIWEAPASGRIINTAETRRITSGNHAATGVGPRVVQSPSRSGPMEMVITNWAKGQGYIREIAGDEVNADRAFDRAVGRMH